MVLGDVEEEDAEPEDADGLVMVMDVDGNPKKRKHAITDDSDPKKPKKPRSK